MLLYACVRTVLVSPFLGAPLAAPPLHTAHANHPHHVPSLCSGPQCANMQSSTALHLLWSLLCKPGLRHVTETSLHPAFLTGGQAGISAPALKDLIDYFYWLRNTPQCAHRTFYSIIPPLIPTLTAFPASCPREQTCCYRDSAALMGVCPERWRLVEGHLPGGPASGPRAGQRTRVDTKYLRLVWQGALRQIPIIVTFIRKKIFFITWVFSM